MRRVWQVWDWCAEVGLAVVQALGQWWRGLPEWVREVAAIEAFAVAWLAWIFSVFRLFEGILG